MFEDKKILRKADIVFGTILILISSFFLFQSFKMPRTADILRAQNNREALLTAPGIMPALVSAILIILGILLIVGALKEGAKLTKEDLSKVKTWFGTVESKNTMIMFAIIVVYIFGLLGRLPYIVSTFIFLAAFMFIFKAASWKWVLFIAALTSIAIAFAFGNIVMIPLP
jgi:hypothetical protein